MRRAYDLDNGIYTEEYERANPFSLIEMHPSEAAANKGKYVELLEFYRLYEVGKELHLSFKDFINLDNDMINSIKECCARWRQEDDDVTRKALAAQGIDPNTNKPIVQK